MGLEMGASKGNGADVKDYSEDGKKGENYDAEGCISRVCPKDEAHRNLLTARSINPLSRVSTSDVPSRSPDLVTTLPIPTRRETAKTQSTVSSVASLWI